MKRVWKIDNPKNNLTKIVLFIFNPLLGFLYSLKSLNTKISVAIVFFFFLLFGLSFSVDSVLYSNDAVGGYLDGMSHRADFENYKDISWSQYKQIVLDMFTGHGERDLYAPTIKFLVSRITCNYHVFFLIISLVFSFFCLKAFSYLVKEQSYDNSWGAIFLAYLFLLMQIFQINGVRFYTAAWISIYAIFKLYVDNDKRYYFLILLSPLVHRAFVFLLIILLVSQIIRNSDKFWISLFFLSFFLSETISTLLASNISLLPDFIASWARHYTETEVRYGDGGFFYDFFALLIRLYRNILIFVIIKNSTQIKSNLKTQRVYRFLLVLATFTNLTMPISNLGSRFAMLTWPIISYIWLVNLKNRYKWLIYLVPFIFFYNAFYYDPLMYAKVLEPCFYYYPPIFLIVKYLIL